MSGLGGDGAGVFVGELGGEAFFGEVGEDVLAAGGGEPLGVGGVVEEAGGDGGDGVGGVFRDEHAVDVVGDDVGDAAGAGGDDGHLRGHGFADAAAEGLFPRGVDEDVEGGEQGLGLVQVVYPVDGADEGGGVGLAAQLRGPVRVFAEEVAPDDDEVCSRVRGADFPGGGDEGVVRFPGDEVRDHADDRGVFGEGETGAGGGAVAGGEACGVDAVADDADAPTGGGGDDFAEVGVEYGRDGDDAGAAFDDGLHDGHGQAQVTDVREEEDFARDPADRECGRGGVGVDDVGGEVVDGS